MTYDDAIALAEEIIEMIEEEVPQHALNKAPDFFEDVSSKVKSMEATITKTGDVSAKQASALENWRDAVQKWIH